MDTPYWTFEILPKIGKQLTTENFDSLKEMVQECLTDPKYAQGRETARQQTWVHQDEGAAHAADYLINKLNQLKETKTEG